MSNLLILKLNSFIAKNRTVLNTSFKYIFIRGVGLVLYFGLSYILVESLDMNAVVATMIGFLVSLIFNYICSYYWVFKSDGSHNIVIAKYLLTVLIAFILNTGIMYITVELLEWWYIYGLIIATVVVPTFNFIMSYLWTFK